jgi:hypothetical protein
MSHMTRMQASQLQHHAAQAPTAHTGMHIQACSTVKATCSTRAITPTPLAQAVTPKHLDTVSLGVRTL